MKKTIEQIYRSLKNSMVGYEVNGNPTKRRFFLYNVAKMLYDKQYRDKYRKDDNIS